MRRKIAALLSIVLLIGIFRGVPTFANSNVKANDKLGFKELSVEVKDNKGTIIQKPQGIKYEKDRLRLVEGPLVDEVAMEWKIADDTAPRNGTYTLDYYIEGGTTTNPKLYNIVFTYGVNTKENNQIDVEVQVKDEQGRVVATNYIPYNPPYGDTDSKVREETTSYKGTLKLNTNTVSVDKEIVLAIGNLSKAKMFVENNKIYVSVTGIKKDYITTFSLSYKRDMNADEETVDFNAFKGIEEFQILPTHLTTELNITTNASLKLSSQTVIDLDKTVGEGELGIEAGSRPGVVVTLSKPKVLVKDGTPKFVTIDQVNTGNKTRQAEIYLEELLGKDSSVGGQKQIKLQFELKNDAPVIDTKDKKQKGRILSHGEKFELYLVKDKSLEGLVENQYKDALVEWPYLEEGMLLNGEISFGGTFFSDTNKTLRFKPDKVGYTYVRYYIYRLTQEDISFKVVPYNISGPVTYTLLKAAAFDSVWDELDKRHYQDKPASEQITLTTKKGYKEKYKISMSTGSDRGEFESQIVQYNGDNDLVPPPYSEIMNVDNVYVVPDDFTVSQGTNTSIKAVGLDMEWRALEREALLSYLKTGNIYYELYLSDSSSKVGKPIKVFKVYLEGNDIKLADYAGTVKGELVYDTARNSFIAKGVVLKDPSTDSNKWEVLEIPQYEGLTQYPEDIKVKEEGDYIVPNTYYLTVRPVYDKKDDSKLAISKYSNPKSIALDIVRKVLPTPETIQSKPLTDDSDRLNQSIYFSPVDLESYVKYMLDPLGLKLHPEGESMKYRYARTYEIYLYQNKVDTGSTEQVPFDKVKEVSYIKDEEGRIGVELDPDQKTFMREENGALLINYDSTINSLPEEELQELIIKELEPNTPYYIQIRTKIDLYSETGKVLQKQVYSVLSKIHSFTTSTKPLPPSPQEQVPPAPEKFFIDSQPNNTTVKLGWEEAEFAFNHKGNIYYEILRSDSAAMDKDDISRLLAIEKVLARNTRYKGFHTEDEYIQTYKSGSWINLEPQQKSNFLRLEENDLRPNSVYYYYIRTVYKLEGEKIYSDWITLPVTTPPLDAPINLKVEPESVYTYDAQHEVVISFLAPIPKDSKVPEEFEFDIAIKGENDEDYRLDYSNILIKEEEGSKEYRKFIYKIKGLTHGIRYDIKVRVVDKTKEEKIYSIYSDNVIVRTDFSEEDQNKENTFNKYLEIYDREAEKLKRNPYWEVDYSVSESIYKYRQSYISAELASFKTYELVTQEDGKSVYYYLPNTFFEEMLKSNTLVTIKLDQYSATLRPSILQGNEQIKAARQNVKDGRYKDFYIGVQFTLTNLTGKIQEQEIISPEIMMNLDIIYLDKEDLIIEDTIIDALDKLIDDGREEVVDDLEDKIKDGKIDEDVLNGIIDKVLEKVVDKHITRVDKILNQAIKRTIELNTIQKEIYLEGLIDSYGIKAYYFNQSKWEEVYVYNTGNTVAIELSRLGSYTFVGAKGDSNLVPNIPGGSDLISKYTLTDFIDVENGLERTVTKEKLYGAVARVLGARRGTDYNLYLKDRGIKLIVPNTLYQPVRQDEAIYIVMQAYEKMYYKNLNSMYISNKLRVENIGAFQPIYRTYVYGAVELGVVVPEGNKVLPSKSITAKDIIRMLSKIVPK